MSDPVAENARRAVRDVLDSGEKELLLVYSLDMESVAFHAVRSASREINKLLYTGHQVRIVINRGLTPTIRVSF